jgi:predicted nucleic acid-binding protein
MAETTQETVVSYTQGTPMSNERAAKVLREYNEYRRGEHWPCDPPYTATEIGNAIDFAVSELERNTLSADIDSIIRAVCHETCVTESEMLEKGRFRRFAEARAIVSWLAHHYTNMTLTAIGERLGRNHVCVIHYNRCVDEWLANPRINERAVLIINKLVNKIKK